MNLEDLLNSLSLADAAVATDEAWHVLYTEITKRADGRPVPDEKELQDSIHQRVHEVIYAVKTTLMGLAFGGQADILGGLLGQPQAETPEPAPAPEPAPEPPAEPFRPLRAGDDPGFYL
jgi:hypothetical protein